MIAPSGCAFCHRSFTMKPYEYRRGRVFCSRKCYQDNRRTHATSRTFARMERLRRGDK